jgi:hypothetical protein
LGITPKISSSYNSKKVLMQLTTPKIPSGNTVPATKNSSTPWLWPKLPIMLQATESPKIAQANTIALKTFFI